MKKSFLNTCPIFGEHHKKSIFSKTNAVYTLSVEDLESELFKLINSNYVYSNFKNIIGHVWEG